jgi:predicted metalloprotease
MSALVSRLSPVAFVRIVALLLALTVLASTPGFASAHGGPREGTDTGEVYVEDIIALAVDDLDWIWFDVLLDFEVDYLPPPVVIYKDDTDTACGGLTAGDDGFGMYCGADGTIYLDAEVLMEIANDYGIFAAAVAIADTWGYALQDQLGETDSGATRDVQATCLAGAWAWYVFDDGRATDEDLDDAAKFYLSLVDGDLLANVFFFGFETDYVSDCFAANS